MKKSQKETKTSKITTKEQAKQQEKQSVKTKKPINKKIIIPISILLIVILIGTLVVLALKNKQESEKILADGQEESGIQEENKEETKSAINLQDNEYMHVELDASNDQVPVPNGYVGSKATGENEIDSGYVIYEGTDEVNDSNVADAQKNRNQYVWIPVPDTSKFYGTDANGKKWGKQYQFSTSTSSSYDQVTGTKPYNWSESNGVMTITSKTSYREPDVVTKSGSTGYDMDSRLKTLGLGATTTHEFLMQMEQEFNRMIASVEKYGGFYIGRYETGDINQETPVIRKGNNNMASVTWYNMYKRCKNLKGSNTNVETGMAWGNQFDRTLMWLIETGNKTKEEICSDSTSWANYGNATFEYVNSSGSTVTKNSGSYTRIPTGSTEYTKANNIYDLAGNVYDWTMEAGGSCYRVLRGGYCYDSSLYASSRSTYTPSTSSSYYGCRAALYIK